MYHIILKLSVFKAQIIYKFFILGTYICIPKDRYRMIYFFSSNKYFSTASLILFIVYDDFACVTEVYLHQLPEVKKLK